MESSEEFSTQSSIIFLKPSLKNCGKNHSWIFQVKYWRNFWGISSKISAAIPERILERSFEEFLKESYRWNYCFNPAERFFSNKWRKRFFQNLEGLLFDYSMWGIIITATISDRNNLGNLWKIFYCFFFWKTLRAVGEQSLEEFL